VARSPYIMDQLEDSILATKTIDWFNLLEVVESRRKIPHQVYSEMWATKWSSSSSNSIITMVEYSIVGEIKALFNK
jgi:hypothetical protein